MRILFVCYANACRSQMAQAYARARAPQTIEIESAGLMAAGIFSRARRVMAEWGIDLEGQRSKTLASVEDQRFDFVVSLSDEAARACDAMAGDGTRLHWPILDPAGVQGSDEELMDVFRLTREDIAEAVDEFLLEHFDEASLRPLPARGPV